jgi:hypothetical protein
MTHGVQNGSVEMVKLYGISDVLRPGGRAARVDRVKCSMNLTGFFFSRTVQGVQGWTGAGGRRRRFLTGQGCSAH